MPLLRLTTSIRAPIERCFDLSRSIDFHIVTAGKTQESAIAGRTTGLIELGETVTWRAKHFGLWQELTVRITEMDRPRHFQDALVKGAFAAMKHNHDFTEADGLTVMTDRFDFRSPFGTLGAFVDATFLGAYMRRFLEERARILKEAAEASP